MENQRPASRRRVWTAAVVPGQEAGSAAWNSHAMNISLESRIALVTGAGEGIGRGCALALAGCGADVIVNDINRESGEATAAAIRSQGRRSLFVPADVADATAVEAMLERVREQFGA